jgi:hypothetical protein
MREEEWEAAKGCGRWRVTGTARIDTGTVGVPADVYGDGEE